MVQVVTTLQNMGRAIGGLHATLASVQRELAALGQAAAAASAPQSPAQPRSRSRTPVRSPAAHSVASPPWQSPIALMQGQNVPLAAAL